MTKTIHRSAITGQIVTEEFAKQNPDTTVTETILNHRDILKDFCDFLEQNGRAIDYSLIDEYLKDR